MNLVGKVIGNRYEILEKIKMLNTNITSREYIVFIIIFFIIVNPILNYLKNHILSFHKLYLIETLNPYYVLLK